MFFVFRNSESNLNEVNIEVRPVYSFVQDCIKQTCEEGVYYVGSSGGYIIAPEKSLNIGFDEGFEKNIAYYPYEEENYMPTKEKIEDEISLYVDSMLAFCIADFNSFPEFEVESGEVVSDVRIETGKVIVDVEYDLSVSKEGQSYEINEFKGNEIIVRLEKIYDAVSEIMDGQMKKKDSVCISCLNDIGNKHGMKIRMSESPEGIVFAIVDEKSQLNERDYEFYFANKYEVENEI